MNARTKQKPGIEVAAPEFDAELHVETTTIMFADVVESVRLIELDELGNVARIRSLLKALAEKIAPLHNGHVLERRGDGLLIKFVDAKCAAACAVAFHKRCEEHSKDVALHDAITLRIGVHGSEVIADGSAIYGQGINLAARVASVAGPGETVVSASVRDHLVAGVDSEIEDLGDCFLKHVPMPVRVFRLGGPGYDPSIPPVNTTKEELLPTIAVMPFEFRGDSSAQVAADLLGETVTHCLARCGALKVIAWASTRALGVCDQFSADASARLRADWWLTGSCTVLGDRVIVLAQLVRRSSGVVEHSERTSDSLDDLLQPESQVAATLAALIVRSVTDAEALRVGRHALPSLSSHSLLLGAIALMHRSRADEFSRSKEALEHLLDRLPRMHSARPWLAKWYVLQTTRGIRGSGEQDADRALSQTHRALDSRPDDAFALAIQGFVYFHLRRDPTRAAVSLEEAIKLNPCEPLANVFCAAVVSANGEFERAWQLAESALRLSPFDPLRAYMRMIASTCAFTSKRYEQAAVLAQQSLRENASHVSAWRTLVISLVQAGRVAEARESCVRLLALEPTLTVAGYAQTVLLAKPARAVAIESLRTAGVPAN